MFHINKKTARHQGTMISQGKMELLASHRRIKKVGLKHASGSLCVLVCVYQQIKDIDWVSDVRVIWYKEAMDNCCSV